MSFQTHPLPAPIHQLPDRPRSSCSSVSALGNGGKERTQRAEPASEPPSARGPGPCPWESLQTVPGASLKLPEGISSTACWFFEGTFGSRGRPEGLGSRLGEGRENPPAKLFSGSEIQQCWAAGDPGIRPHQVCRHVDTMHGLPRTPPCGYTHQHGGDTRVLIGTLHRRAQACVYTSVGTRARRYANTHPHRLGYTWTPV